MKTGQGDLFAQDNAERKTLPDAQRSVIRSRLEDTLAKLERTETFPWQDPLDAVHLENRFQRDTELLGEEGVKLWTRFDKEMDRLHSMQFEAEDGAADLRH